ncbi:MAG: membrane protein insertion efficiency factor YidD [bacterium]|nr:membrane protein insertion efficiency factor YidD [bacterium]
MNNGAKQLLLFLIKFYQISSDYGIWRRPGRGCRFYPSCSSYAYQAIEKNGTRKGFWRALKRILRCHPFSQGGVDLPHSFDL